MGDRSSKKNTEIPSKEELIKASVQVRQKLTIGRWVTHLSYGAILVLISWLNFLPADSSIKLWIVKVIPLLIFIPGFLQQKYRTYSWLCFAILPYFIWITPLVMARGDWSDWTMIVLIVILFIAAMMTSRWMQQQSHLDWQISNTPSN